MKTRKKPDLKVVKMPQGKTAKGAIRAAARNPLKEAVVIGYDNEGNIYINASDMQRDRQLWMLEDAKRILLNPDG